MDPRALIASMPIGAMLIGPEGRVTAANARLRDLFGAEFLGRDYVTALRRPELVDAIDRARATRQSQTARLLQRRSNNDLVWQVSIAPIAEALGEESRQSPPHMLVTFEDVTPLEAAEQMRRDFVANVSHELKSPLTALLGFIETLQGPARDDPAARARFLTIMEAEAQRMNRLVSDLLSLSRVEAEERQRPEGELALAGLLSRTLASLAAAGGAKGAKLDLVLPPDEVRIPGDADQLQQVLSNLIENAVKYGRPGGQVTVRLLPLAPDPVLGQSAATIEVEDEGEGIDPLHLPRLTERFYRVDTHRSRQSGGTGLGLAIVKHIISRHRGRLKVESQKGKGSKFSVILPASVKKIR